jgi:ribonuclease HI
MELHLPNLIIYADGLCEPTNPGGWGCWGWTALATDGTPLICDFGNLGRSGAMTNNIAEYRAVINALTTAKEHGWNGFTIRTDSQLVVNQVNRLWACKAPHLLVLCKEAQTLLQEVGAKLEWVRREENELVDALTRRAFKETTGHNPALQALRQKDEEFHQKTGKWQLPNGQVITEKQAAEFAETGFLPTNLIKTTKTGDLLKRRVGGRPKAKKR